MMQKVGGGANYIKDGLVFWLDGIDKGGTQGVWTDLIQGITFTPNNNGVIFNDNNVYCPASYGLYYNGSIYAPLNSYTIEAAFNGILMGDVVFTTGYRGGDMLMMGSYSGFHVFATGGACDVRPANSADTFRDNVNRLISANSARAVANFDSITPFNNGDAVWSDEGISTIGYGYSYGAGRSYKYIYSIRIYNRQLSIDEMVHNQQVDNKRFNLGI